jgi:protease IV
LARTRDIVIGVIIGGCFLVFFLIMAIILMYGRMNDADGFSGLGSKVAIVNLEGVITSSSDIVRQLDRWGKDDAVRAIVMHINSPGGGVAPSQEIYDRLMKLRAETGKPVVVSMASVCASGGYYIACAADRIVAVPGSVTGSIGVIFQWPVVNRLMDKVGVQFETIKSGKVKDVGSPYREATEDERAMLQAVVDDTYDQFVSVVSERRGLPRDSTEALATGAVYTGRQAQRLGLVDSLGTFDDAVDLAGELSGLGSNPDRIKESQRRRMSIFDVLGSITNLDLNGLLNSKQELTSPKLQYIFE